MEMKMKIEKTRDPDLAFLWLQMLNMEGRLKMGFLSSNVDLLPSSR